MEAHLFLSFLSYCFAFLLYKISYEKDKLFCQVMWLPMEQMFETNLDMTLAGMCGLSKFNKPHPDAKLKIKTYLWFLIDMLSAFMK